MALDRVQPVELDVEDVVPEVGAAADDAERDEQHDGTDERVAMGQHVRRTGGGEHEDVLHPLLRVAPRGRRCAASAELLDDGGRLDNHAGHPHRMGAHRQQRGVAGAVAVGPQLVGAQTLGGEPRGQPAGLLLGAAVAAVERRAVDAVGRGRRRCTARRRPRAPQRAGAGTGPSDAETSTDAVAAPLVPAQPGDDVGAQVLGDDLGGEVPAELVDVGDRAAAAARRRRRSP